MMPSLQLFENLGQRQQLFPLFLPLSQALQKLLHGAGAGAGAGAGSGSLYKVSERCEAVPELPKVLLKMASGLISPSGHRRQLCIVSVFLNHQS